MNALFYNWWSLFVRLISPEARREAQTSRPKMLAGVGRVTRHGRQKKLLLTIAHAASRGLRAAFEALARFLREIRNAPQLSAVERWCRILSRACLQISRREDPEAAPRASSGLIQGPRNQS